MGKKRRILTRTTKFAKKYFEFLDKVDASSNVIDSTEVDDLIEVGDTFIDSISVADNNNETVTVTGRVLGGGHTTGNVEVSIDGGAFGVATAATRDAGDGGLDEITYSIKTTTALGKGTHTARVRKASETVEGRWSELKSFEVRQNKIDIAFTAGAGATSAFNDNTSDNISLDASDITITGGKKKAGDENNAVLGGNGDHAVGIRIEVFLASDFARASGQTLTGGSAFLDIPATTNPFAGADDANILVADITENTDFVIRVTPFSADDTPVLLTDSALERTLSVAKA